MTDQLFEQLLAAPQVCLYVQRIQDVLEAEQQRREQFYATLREDEKSEFINGDVIVHSPVKYEHTNAGRRLLILLSVYVEHHQLGFVGYEKTLVSLTRNDYEPDLCFFARARADQFQPGQMRFPAPDFVVEILSPSTEEKDRGVKFTDYAAHGVAEYWLIEPESETLEQYLLDEDVYTLHTKARTGDVRSVAVPGFVLPIRALFDSAVHMAALQQIMADASA